MCVWFPKVQIINYMRNKNIFNFFYFFKEESFMLYFAFCHLAVCCLVGCRESCLSKARGALGLDKQLVPLNGTVGRWGLNSDNGAVLKRLF